MLKLDPDVQDLDTLGSENVYGWKFCSLLVQPFTVLSCSNRRCFSSHLKWRCPLMSHVTVSSCPLPWFFYTSEGGPIHFNLQTGNWRLQLMSLLSLHFWEDAQQSQILDPCPVPCVPAPSFPLLFLLDPSDTPWVLQRMWGTVQFCLDGTYPAWRDLLMLSN